MDNDEPGPLGKVSTYEAAAANPKLELSKSREKTSPAQSSSAIEDVLYIQWAPNDPEDPFCWPKRKKNVIAAVAIFLTFLTASSAVAYSWAVDQLIMEFHISRTVGILGITLFTFGFAAAPMALAPLSEVYGRNPIYLVAYAIFVLLFIPQALSPNITGLLLARFFSGVFASTGATMVGGTLSDMYRAETRGGPMSCFASVSFYGTALASIASAYVASDARLRWRWIFWLQLIINGAYFVVLLVLLKETRGSVLLARRAARMRRETGDARYMAASEVERESLLTMVRVSLTRPFIFLVTEPAVIAYSVWVAFVWGVLYLFLEAIPIVFQGVFGFSFANASLGFLGMVVGTTAALALAPVQDRLYNASADGKGGKPRPEARLYASMAGSLLFSAGMFIFGWCAYSDVHWIGAMIGVGVTSFGIYTIYLAVFNILADTYGKYASSALASQSFLRNVFASGFPLFANQMYAKLGVHWASSLLAFIGLGLCAVPFGLYAYGPRLRKASRYASAD